MAWRITKAQQRVADAERGREPSDPAMLSRMLHAAIHEPPPVAAWPAGEVQEGFYGSLPKGDRE